MSITHSLRDKVSQLNLLGCTKQIGNLIFGEREFVVPDDKKAQVYENGKLLKTLTSGKHQIPTTAEIRFVKTVEIAEDEMGLIYQDGKLSAVYAGGFYDIDEQANCKTVRMEAPLSTTILQQIKQLPNEGKAFLSEFSIQSGHLALISCKNHHSVLKTPGNYAFWAHENHIQILQMDDRPEELSMQTIDILKEEDCIQSIVLLENQIAVHKIDDVFDGILAPNHKYIYWNVDHKHTFEIIVLDGHPLNDTTEMYHDAMEPYLEHFTVKENCIGVLKRGNAIQTILTKAGTYSFWKSASLHQNTEFRVISLGDGFVTDETMQYIGTTIATLNNTQSRNRLFLREYGPGILCDKNKFVQYYAEGEECALWQEDIYQPNSSKQFYNAPAIDKQLFMELKEQGMLTKDNACLKVNAVCYYTIHDYADFCSCNTNYHAIESLTHPSGKKEAYQSIINLYLQFQIALKDYIANHTLDEALASRQAIVTAVYEQLKAKESEFGVVLNKISIKDFMFSSAYQEMQNQVLLAEKRAQIKAIERREEVNNNRTLLNTAKLMQENKVMYDLRKLEIFEKVCSGSKEIRLAMQQFMGENNQ